MGVTVPSHAPTKTPSNRRRKSGKSRRSRLSCSTTESGSKSVSEEAVRRRRLAIAGDASPVAAPRPVPSTGTIRLPPAGERATYSSITFLAGRSPNKPSRILPVSARLRLPVLKDFASWRRNRADRRSSGLGRRRRTATGRSGCPRRSGDSPHGSGAAAPSPLRAAPSRQRP